MTASYQVRACILAWISVLSFLKSNNAAQVCHIITVNKLLSLQDAIDAVLIASAGSGSSNCSSIALPAGEHILSSQVQFPTDIGSLALVGLSQQSVSVSCVYSVETNYTWYFSKLESLSIQNIHFHNCPRPLRVDTVAEVEITNCSFRSVSFHTYTEEQILIGLYTMCLP